MPIYPLHELTEDEGLRAIAGRLSRLAPGLVLTTGQVGSGRVTTLAALAALIAGGNQSVIVMSDRPEATAPFEPLPGNWRLTHVEPSSRAWEAALGSREAADADVLLVASLSRENAATICKVRTDRWVLASVDTPLIGLDVAHVLYEMGVDNATFAERTRCIWSQFLVEKLCRECSRPARLPPEELAYLFPSDPPPEGIREEVGCPSCDHRGTKHRDAICDVMLVGDAARPAIRSALLEGAAPALGPEWRVTAREQAFAMLARGAMGVRTYRNAIRRNPLLRAENTIAREQVRASRLDLASKHKSEFLANMSHELRTPLNAIIGFSEVILNGMAGPVSDSQKEFIGDIHDSGRHLLSLINDILDLSKIEAGKMELHLTRFSLPLAIDSAITLVRGRADRQGVSLEHHVGPDVAECEGDERKVKQIALNLLTNAVKFTPEGGTVGLTAKRVNGAYEISVRDTGIGIAPADQEKLFEEFRQVGTDAARKAEGTGLGLSLTRRLVELHGGTIRVQSAPGQGSTFTFTLPNRS